MTVARRALLVFAILALVAAGGGFAWRELRPSGPAAEIVASNGHIEAVEIDVAGKTSGRLEDVFVAEGEFVSRGQVLARMDTSVLEARLVLDVAPHYVLPAIVSYVADVAQFTPKTVETAEERQNLMFHAKTSIAPELLRRHVRQVKTGLPGVAYVRLNAGVPWPPELQIR